MRVRQLADTAAVVRVKRSRTGRRPAPTVDDTRAVNRPYLCNAPRKRAILVCVLYTCTIGPACVHCGTDPIVSCAIHVGRSRWLSRRGHLILPGVSRWAMRRNVGSRPFESRQVIARPEVSGQVNHVAGQEIPRDCGHRSRAIGRPMRSAVSWPTTVAAYSVGSMVSDGFVRNLWTQCVHTRRGAPCPAAPAGSAHRSWPGVLSSPIPEAFLQSMTGWKRQFECGA